MSDWESDKQAGWGDEPAPAPAKRGLFGKKQPAMPPESGRDWRLIEKLVMSLQTEQRRSRRWGIFFKFLTFGYLFALLFLIRSPIGDGMAGGVCAHAGRVGLEWTLADEEGVGGDEVVGGGGAAFA